MASQYASEILSKPIVCIRNIKQTYSLYQNLMNLLHLSLTRVHPQQGKTTYFTTKLPIYIKNPDRFTVRNLEESFCLNKFDTPVFFTNKTYLHDITERLLIK